MSWRCLIVGPPYYDVTSDDHVAPNDALAVINYINAFGLEGESLHAGMQRASSPPILAAQSPPDELISLLAVDVATQPRRWQP